MTAEGRFPDEPVICFMKQLQDKVAIITGGSRGIGKVTAQTFLEAGAGVSVWDIDREGGELALKEWLAQGFEVDFQLLNTAEKGSVEAAAQAVADRFGRIDILVNNAGITRDSSTKNMTEAQWQSVIDVNLSGVFHCTKAVYPFMAARGWGRILNASSVVALYGNFGQANYVAAKAGLIGLTKVWAREFGPKGITLNAVAPGFIQTDMINTIPAEYLNDLLTKTPLRRMGQPQDVANAYLFLASEQAAFITGITLSVDGGLVV